MSLESEIRNSFASFQGLTERDVEAATSKLLAARLEILNCLKIRSEYWIRPSRLGPDGPEPCEQLAAEYWSVYWGIPGSNSDSEQKWIAAFNSRILAEAFVFGQNVRNK